MNNGLFAGFGQRDITPEALTPLAGFDVRKGKASGVHDPLYVRAVTMLSRLDSPAESGLVLVEVDLLGTAMYLCGKIKQRIRALMEEARPQARIEIQIGAIHTHAAPQSVFKAFDCFDEHYLDVIAFKAAEAASDSLKDLHPVKALVLESSVSSVGSFRDVPREKSLFDMPLKTLWLRDPALNRPDMLLVLFACHPTVLNESNYLISRDLCWGFEEEMAERLQEKGLPKANVLLMNGACADISTRYTRKEASFEEALRLGGRMAQAVLIPEETDNWAVEGQLLSSEIALEIPPARFFAPEERQEIIAYLTEKIESCRDEAQKREYTSCKSVLERPHYGKNRTEGIQVNLSLVQLVLMVPARYGRTAPERTLLLGIPFEYAQKDAVRLAGRIRMKCGSSVWIRCYTGGYEGYLPSGEPLSRDSSYEDMASSYAPHAKELLAKAVLDVL